MGQSWITILKEPDALLLVVEAIVFTIILYKWVWQRVALKIQKLMVMSLLPLLSMWSIYLYATSPLSIVCKLLVLITATYLQKLWFK